MHSFSSLDRSTHLKTITDTKFDLIVIGGGITGCGIALDAASRGLKTLLVEKEDFASGTSSRSTKLIHGGLRYLKQFEIALVREVGMERAKVHKIAPHLVKSEKMLLPIIKNGTFGKMLTSVGLMVYDILAGVERADQRKMLNKAATLEKEPLLPEERVEGGGLYAEYRTDDARLTIEIAKTAAQHGAYLLNYCKADDFIYENEQVHGLVCRDLRTDELFNVYSKYIVSAAGPWVDELRKKNNSLNQKHLFLSKGVHIVVDHDRFPVQQAVYFDVSDGRMIFAIPRGKTTYIGTTDTEYKGDKNHIMTDEEDARYLLNAVNHMFPDLKLEMKDIRSSWAGVRPLIHEEGKSASEISRKDEIFESETGLISIAGGKLTGYRKMAQKVVDLVARKYERDHHQFFPKCSTDKIILTGGTFEDAADVDYYTRQINTKLAALDLEPQWATYLVENYGKQTDIILNKMHTFSNDHSDINLTRAEVWFTVHHEMVFTPLDFFSRRSGRLYFRIDTIPEVLDIVIEDMANYLNWDEATKEKERQSVVEAVHEASLQNIEKVTTN